MDNWQSKLKMSVIQHSQQTVDIHVFANTNVRNYGLDSIRIAEEPYNIFQVISD